MPEPFEYLSKARLVYHEGYRYAYPTSCATSC